MRWKEFVRDYFSFSYRDRIAVLTLLFIIIFLIFLPGFIHKTNRPVKAGIDTVIMAKLQKLSPPTVENSNKSFQPPDNHSYSNYNATSELFYFDPNKIGDEEWRRLGLRAKTIQTIRHYISKGGRFKKADDLQKVYGLFPGEYARLSPYIRIGSIAQPDSSGHRYMMKYPIDNRSHEPYHIDINASDTSAWIALPGIGSKLAARIVNFRDKLGGFYSIDQVKETYGLPDSTFQKIRPFLFLEANSVKMISLNRATLEELKAHPYIRWMLANPIIAYRNEHGAFHNLEELKNIMAITNEAFEKMKHYLVVE